MIESLPLDDLYLLPRVGNAGHKTRSSVNCYFFVKEYHLSSQLKQLVYNRNEIDTVPEYRLDNNNNCKCCAHAHNAITVMIVWAMGVACTLF